MVCSFEPCEGEARALGLCWAHYAQQRRGQPLRPLLPYRGPRGGRRRTRPDCSFEGCERPNRGKGLCNGHRRQRDRGQTLRPLRPSKAEQRR
jgi:hypothetical protein